MKRFFISGYNYIQDIVLEAGTYTFWAYIKSDFGNTFTFALANAANEWEVFDVDVQQGQWTKAYEVFTIKEKKVKLSLIYRYFDAEHPVYVLKPQLIKGNIPSDAGSSPFDIDKVTDDLHDAIGGIEDFTNEEFADRVLSSGERVSLRRDLEAVEVIFQSLKGSYEKLLINPFVNALVLADLTAKYNAVSSAKDNLFTTLNTIIAGDNIVTPEEIAAKDLALSSLNNALYAYNTAEKEIANALGEDYTQKIGAIRDFTDTEFADRMLSETERVSLRHDLDNVQTLLDEITASYDEIVLNPYLTVADITLLTDKYNALFDAWDWDYDIDPSKPDGLKTVILDIINGDEIVTQAEIDEKDLALANFNNKLGEYSTVEVQMSKFAIDHAIEQAAFWSINATSPVIYKDAKDAITDGVHTQVTVKGQLHRGTDIQDGGFITITPNGETEPATAVSSPITISPSDNADKSSYTVRLYDTASKTTLLDTLTIPVVFKGASGVNAINVVLSNEADVLPASPEGVVSDYSGSGTTIRVFEGATELDYDGIGSANGKFNVTATSTGITVGTKSENGLMCVFGNASNMTLDNAFITFTISGKTQAGASFSVTKTQSFAKARTGQKGDQGLQGIPGVPGADGVTYYTWIRYADTPTSGMSQYPDGKPYIGLAYNKTTPTESSVYADYKWSLLKGEQGIPGQKGADGIQYYTWIKYADSPTSGMSDDPTGKAYIGIAVNKTTATESTNYADYTWQLTKGEKGDTGASAPLLYLSASSHVMKCNPDNTPQTGQTITFEAKLQNVTGTATFTATPYNDAGVAQTPITLGGSGNIRTLTDSQWLAAYKRVEVVATLGSLTDKVTIYRVTDGASGRGISSTVVTYQVGSSGTTAPTGTWLSTIPTVPEGQYLWTRTVTTYTDSTTSTSYSVSRQAPTGAAGRGIISTVITYQSSASGTVIPDGTWSSTIPYVAENEYLWTRTVITYTDSTTSTSYSVGKMGAKGTDAIVGFLTNESVTLQANSSGVVSSFASANGEFWVYNGTTKVTSGITFSKVSETGCTAAITSAGVYSVSAMSADNATVVLRAVYNGVTIDKILSLSKSKAGTDGVSITLVDVEFAKNTTPATAPTTGWTTTAPTLAEGEQLWTRTKTTYSSGSPTYSTPANITPKKGDTGAAGQGVESVTEEYAISTSKTTQPTTGWSTTQPTWVQGQYIWSRVKVVYKNPASTVYTGYAVSSEWEAVNELEIGGRNLILNSQARAEVTNGSDQNWIAPPYYLSEPLKIGQKYTFYCEGIEGTSINRLSFRDPASEFFGVTGNKLTFTATAESTYLYLYLSDYSATYKIGGIKLVKGDKCDDWTPAPEDVQAEIDAAAITAQSALSAANTAQATADGKIETFYQTTAPTTAHEGDIWFDTDEGNKIYTYRSGTWVNTQDSKIAQAINSAQTAQTTADGKAKVYYQTSAPTGMTANDKGDMWVDTDANNKLYIYNGSAWVVAQDYYAALMAANNAQTTADDAQLAAEGYMKARYIRDWIKGSTLSTNNVWREINVIRKDGTNVAQGKTPSSNGTFNASYPAAKATDNNINTYAQINGTTPATSNYIRIDLGQVYNDIDYIQIWHDYADGRTFYGTKTEISVDGATWTTIYDSATMGTYEETIGGKTHSQRRNRIAAEVNRSKAITDNFGTRVNGGLISTVITEYRELDSPQVTGLISGIQGTNKDLPFLVAGGTYNDALSGTAKAIIRHDGSVKFTDGLFDGIIHATSGEFTGLIHAQGGNVGILDIDLNGNVKLMDSTYPTLVRLLFTRSSIPTVDDIVSTSQYGGSTTNSNAIYSTSGSTTLTNYITVTKDSSKLTFSGTVSLEAELDISHGYTDGYASVEIILIKDGSTYVTLSSIEEVLDEQHLSTSRSFTVNKELIVPAGVYKIQVKRTFANTHSAAGGMSGTSTLAWSFVKDIRRFEFGLNGFMAWYTNNHMHFSENGGLDVRGKTDIPGLLAMGRVSSTGAQDTNKIWGAKAATDNCTKNGTGVFRVPHKVLHSKITGIAIPTSSNYLIAQTGETAAYISGETLYNGYVEFTITSRSSGANSDIGFNYYIYGKNY